MKKLSEVEMAAALHSYLFSGIDETELKIMLPCLAAERRVYARNEFIFRAGAHIHQVGLVLSGCADILRDDYWGSRHIVAPVLPGETTPVSVQHIVRSFDPCMVCTVH